MEANRWETNGSVLCCEVKNRDQS